MARVVPVVASDRLFIAVTNGSSTARKGVRLIVGDVEPKKLRGPSKQFMTPVPLGSGLFVDGLAFAGADGWDVDQFDCHIGADLVVLHGQARVYRGDKEREEKLLYHLDNPSMGRIADLEPKSEMYSLTFNGVTISDVRVLGYSIDFRDLSKTSRTFMAVDSRGFLINSQRIQWLECRSKLESWQAVLADDSRVPVVLSRC